MHVELRSPQYFRSGLRCITTNHTVWRSGCDTSREDGNFRTRICAQRRGVQPARAAGFGRRAARIKINLRTEARSTTRKCPVFCWPRCGMWLALGAHQSQSAHRGVRFNPPVPRFLSAALLILDAAWRAPKSICAQIRAVQPASAALARHRDFVFTGGLGLPGALPLTGPGSSAPPVPWQSTPDLSPVPQSAGSLPLPPPCCRPTQKPGRD